MPSRLLSVRNEGFTMVAAHIKITRIPMLTVRFQSMCTFVLNLILLMPLPPGKNCVCAVSYNSTGIPVFSDLRQASMTFTASTARLLLTMYGLLLIVASQKCSSSAFRAP